MRSNTPRRLPRRRRHPGAHRQRGGEQRSVQFVGVARRRGVGPNDRPSPRLRRRGSRPARSMSRRNVRCWCF